MRFALSGFTFILMAFLILLPNLLTFLQNVTVNGVGLVSVFLAFFTLLQGSAIGFLTSQLWWWFFNGWLRENKLIDARKYLREKYVFTRNGEKYVFIERDIHKETAILDYIFHLVENPYILTYTQRRWDCYTRSDQHWWRCFSVLLLAYCLEFAGLALILYCGMPPNACCGTSLSFWPSCSSLWF